MHSIRLRSMLAVLALFTLLLATAVSANATPVAAAQGSASSKVPALVQARVAEIQAAHRAGRPVKPLSREALALGLIDASTAGAFDLQIHTLGPVGTAEA